MVYINRLFALYIAIMCFIPFNLIPKTPEYTHLYHIVLGQHIQKQPSMLVRTVSFEDDLLSLLELDDNLFKQYQHKVKDLMIIVQATQKYLSKRGEKLAVEVANNRWSIFIEDAPIRLILNILESDPPVDPAAANILRRYAQGVKTVAYKALLWTLSQTVGRFAQSNVILYSNIDPCVEDIPFSEIVLDMVDLHHEGKLNTKVSFENIFKYTLHLSDR